MEKIYKIDKINYSGDDKYRIIEGIDQKGNRINLKGVIPFRIKINNTIIVSGRKSRDKYGDTILIDTVTLDTKSNNDSSIIALLTRTKGIGNVTAKRIKDKYGEKTVDIITNNHTIISENTGISSKLIERLHHDLVIEKTFTDYVNRMKKLGCGTNLIYKLYNKIGALAYHKIVENPYSVIEDSKIDFIDMDDIAMNLGFENDIRIRIEAIIIEYLKNRATSGDIYVEEENIYRNIEEFLYNITERECDKDFLSNRDIYKAIKELEKKEDIVIENNAIYLKGYYFMEKEIAYMIADRIKEESKEIRGLSSIIKKDMMKGGYRLTNKQLEAILIAINSNISIINGAPGTGKTFTINKMIETIIKVNSNSTIELAAPTGKAAKKMAEITGFEAKTIHRLIGLGFNDNIQELKRVKSDYLILDEISMIDTELFYTLLSNVSLHTKIIMVGDHNQLQSIGPGATLKDLLDSKQLNTTTLDKVYRQGYGSDIINNLDNIVKGDTYYTKSISGKGSSFFIESNNDNEIAIIVKSIANMISNQGYSLDDIIVLSPINKSELGVGNLNKIIQKRFNNNNGPKFRANGYDIGIDDKIIHVENNYNLEVYNGDTGKVIDIKGSGREIEVIVDYNGRIVQYGYEDKNQLSLAYAITIHKSQGSEYPVVILPFHSSVSIMLNRSSIYTGLSRASEKIVCVGNKEEYDNGVKREVQNRNTSLSERIMELSGEKNKEKIIVGEEDRIGTELLAPVLFG